MTTPNHTAERTGAEPTDAHSRRQFLVHGVAAGVAMSAGGTLIAACGSSSSTTSSSGATTGAPKRGGTLTVGIGGGGPTDSMDPAVVLDVPDQTYAFAMFDQLTQVDESQQLVNRLAEDVSHNTDASEWTVRLRKGVEFHNGKTLKAEDVIYSFQRIMNPKTHASAAWLGAVIKSMKKVDDYTVTFVLNQPMGWFDVAIGDGGLTGIVPVGFSAKTPIGTGPFKFVSYTPGQTAVFERFPNYWGGPAYLDKLVIHTINDDSARLNALLTGQIDLSPSILTSQIAQVKSTPGLVVYNSPSSGFSPFTMRVDKAPFNDVRVRQALRLSIDRDQVLTQAYSGYGTVGNDLYSPFDPDFDHSLVRHQDLDQAKSLLKQAGASGLTVQLTVSQLFPGIVQQAEVMAQNASLAGINIQLNQVDAATLFGPNYLSWPFAMDIYPGLRYLTTSVLADGPFAAINETHFKDPKYERLWKQASATLSPTTRKEALTEMQEILFNEGGYIITSFPNAIGAMTSKLGGVPAKDVRGFGPIATDQNKLYLSS